MKKIIPIFLVVLLLCQTTIFAAEIDLNDLMNRYVTDLIDMDRVFKYDYMESQSDESGGGNSAAAEELKYHNAAHAVMALGLMEPLENGLFKEDEAVPFKTFAKMIMKLTTGSIDEIEAEYERYPDTRYTTYHEAAHYLVGALGYDLYDAKQGGDHPRSKTAISIGLTKGLTFVGEKNITRGELALMVLNALQTDMIVQTTFGSEEEYEKLKGHTLLSEKLDAAIIYGTVTAQNGVNLYLEKALDQDYIAIDRAPYRLTSTLGVDLLGYQVQAVATKADDDVYELLDVTVDERDETIALMLDDSVYTDNRYIYYQDENGREQKQNLSSFERIVLNDTVVSVSQLASAIAGGEGELRIAKTERNGNYSLAVIRSWSTFIAHTVSDLSRTINLGNGATFHGKSYIEVNSDLKQIYIEQNGQKKSLTDIPSGAVIDVIESVSGDAITIVISDKSVSGTITQTEGNAVYIDGKRYLVSSSYKEAQKHNSQLPNLSVGKSGTFYLNVNNKIADATLRNESYTLGLLKEYKRIGSGLNSGVGLRIFSEENEWKELELADKLMMDGISGVTKEEAYLALEGAKEAVCYAPVRFAVNAADKIHMLDTAIVNEVEKGDPESIIKAGTYSGTTNWTASNTMEWTSLDGSKYFFTKATKFMIMPTDKSKEKEYTIGQSSFLVEKMTVNMDLYNADDFNVAGIIVRSGSASNVLAFNQNYSWMVFTGLSNSIDSDGNPITLINGFESSSAKFVQNSFQLESDDLVAQAKTFKEGDIVHFSADGKKMLEMKMWCRAEDIDKADITDDPVTDAVEALGYVIDVDPARTMALVNVNGQEQTWRIHCLGLYDRARNKGSVIKAGDILPGDRVFGLGGASLMRMLIIR